MPLASKADSINIVFAGANLLSQEKT